MTHFICIFVDFTGSGNSDGPIFPAGSFNLGSGDTPIDPPA